MKWPDTARGAAVARAVTLVAVLVLLADALLFGGEALERACRAVPPALERAALAR